MTIRETLEERLVNSGLWPDEAKSVVEAMIKDDADNDQLMVHRWGESVDNYPKPLMSVLWLTAKQRAISWIDENKPQHFAKLILSGESQ